MALDLEVLRAVATGGSTVEAERADDFCCVLAAQSLLEVVRYLKHPGRSTEEAVAHVKSQRVAVFAWGVVYALLGAVSLVISAVAWLVVFGFSASRPAWPRLVKIPLMVIAGFAGIYAVPTAIVLFAAAVICSSVYLVWAGPGQLYRGAATTWCFVPGVLQRISRR